MFILRSFSQDGFVFLIDSVWGPNKVKGFIGWGTVEFPFFVLVKLFSYIFSFELIQKFVLWISLVLPAITMYKFVRYKKLNIEWAFFSGSLYMMNPYVYERFLAGHWRVLLGYAIFPLLIKYFLVFIDKSNKVNCWKFIVLFSILPWISIHWFYISVLFLVFIAVAKFLKVRDLDKLKASGKKVLLTSLVFILFNSFWLVNFFDQDKIFSHITKNDFQAFQTQTDASFGVLFNVLSMYGFWHDTYIVPKDYFFVWWMMTIVIIVLSMIGIFERLKKKDLLAISVMSFIPLALIIAIGYGSNATKVFINFFIDNIPGFIGMRDTTKIIGVIVFIYALYFPLGVKKLLGEVKQRSFGIMIYILCILIPILISYGMLNSFNNQITIANYPTGWNEVNNILEDSKNVKKVLFVPWQGYIRLNFAGNIKVANSASSYFSSDIVSGKLIDNVYIAENYQNEFDKLIFDILLERKIKDEVLQEIKNLNISHIIMAKTDDWERYAFFNNNYEFEILFDDESVMLFEVR